MKNWNGKTQDYFVAHLSKWRDKRARNFLEKMRPKPTDVVLDLGSLNGDYLAKYYPYPKNIFLADINEHKMKEGVKRNGLGGYFKLDENGRLPFEDNAFDIVFCNSVIEHVTIPKKMLGEVTNTEFYKTANANQEGFIKEINRISKKYFIQTPYKHFPLEAHSWMPFVQYLSHTARWWLSQVTKKWWVASWNSDFYLYDKPRFAEHCVGATKIEFEKTLGVTKALIAIKGHCYEN